MEISTHIQVFTDDQFRVMATRKRWVPVHHD